MKLRPGSRGTLAQVTPALLIALLAVACRLWRLDLAHFQDDQATLLNLARDFLEGQRFPFFGMTFAIGVRHPPLEVFLLALPLLISYSPIVATAFVALVDAAGVLVCYLIGARFLGGRAGMAAGLLYAVNPVALVFARRVWNPSLVPFLSGLTLLALLMFLVRRRPFYAGLAIFTWGCMAQLHLATIAYLPLLAAVLALNWRALRWRWVLAGIGLLLLTLAPFLYYQATHGFEDLKAFVPLVLRPGPWDPLALLQPLALPGAPIYLSEIRQPGAGLDDGLALRLAGLLELAVFGGGMLALLGSALGLLRRRQWRQAATPLLICAWVLPPLSFALRHQVPLAPHYFLGLYPAPFLAIGALVERGWGPSSVARVSRAARETLFSALRPSRLLGRAAALATCLVAAVQLAALPPFLDTVARYGAAGGYDPPVGYSIRAARLAARAAGPGSAIYVGSRDEMGGVLDYLLRGPHLTRRFDIAHTLLLPASNEEPALYVVQDDGGPVSVFLRESAGSYRIDQAAAPGGAAVYTLYRLGPGFADELRQRAGLKVADATFGGAARILAYQLSSRVELPGVASAQLLWEVSADPSSLPGETAQFGHVIDGRGKAWGGQDYRGYPRYLWRAGDRVVSWFDMPVEGDTPAGVYWLGTGFYNRYTQARLEARDGSGKDLGSEVRLGPMKLTRSREQSPPGRVLAAFGDAITLESSSLHATVRADEELRIALRWRPLARPSRDYTIFVHLVDGTGKLAAQADSQPAQGGFPTSFWDPGEPVEDVHMFPAGGLRPGRYAVWIGMYTLHDLKRLPVKGPNGENLGDHLVLGEITVGL